jgi:O-antigen ligase
VDLDSSQLLELSGALLGSVIIFIAAYAAPLRVSVAILLVLIPFQPVETSYGSANIAMAYVLAGALLVKGRLVYAPILGSILVVVFAYLVSMSQVPRSVYVLHGVEVVALISAFLVLVLAYNLAREVEDPKFLVNIFVVMNVLAVLYCLVQFSVAPGESLEMFGSKEFALNKNRGEGDARLVGPFGTPGITAAFFMTMTLILVYDWIYSKGRRRLWLAGLAIANITMILATANRGSFLVLLGGLLWFVYLFRHRLGFAGVVQIITASTVIIIGMASVVATYTEFGQMFDRLGKTTEFEEGVPSTRAVVWPLAWETVQERPILGHGPRILQQHELRFRHVPSRQLVSPYPHSLYLYLLVTVGIVGLSAMLFFFGRVLYGLAKGAKRGVYKNDYEKGLVSVGFIVVATFLIDELKIEFLRNGTADYAQFMFALFGVFLGWADRGCAQARTEALVSRKNGDRISAPRDRTPTSATTHIVQ